ncbi:hypothetical protein REH81_03480, partial [Vibrio rotiferianus]
SKKYILNSKVYGFFHTSYPNNLLALNFTNSRFEPKPDVIFFNSDQYKESFIDKNDSITTKSFHSLKHYRVESSAPLLQEYTSQPILVVFSGNQRDIDLMCDLINSYRGNTNFLLRTHPMYRFDVESKIQIRSYEVDNSSSLDIVFTRVTKVISTYSALALEASLKGKAVGLVYDRKRLLFNPFDNTDQNNYSLISSDNELSNFIELPGLINDDRTNSFYNLDKLDYSYLASQLNKS